MAEPHETEASDREVRRSLLRLWGLTLLATAAVFLFAWFLIGPPPPRHFRLGAGPADGSYHRHAVAYADLLARQGIRVEVVETAGSVENLAALEAGDVDVGLVQGGTATQEQRARLSSIASVFFEPLWILYRRDHEVRTLEDVAGLRIAEGEDGSGTRDLTERVLRATGVLDADPAPRLVPIGGGEAADALQAGEVDVAFFVVAPGPPWLRDLLADPDIGVVPLPRLEAIARRYAFLSTVRVPRGLLDLHLDAPPRDLELLAPTAALVTRPGFHPALAALLIEAAKTRHADGSLLADPGRFPSPHFVDVPLSEDARRVLLRGPSWTYRVFPFWFASFLDRAIVVLLPLLTLLLPLAKTAPPLYRWGVRRRIYLWYREVRSIDQAVRERASPEVLRASQERLRRMEREVANVKIPLSYMREFYDLRLHLDFVRRRLQTALEEERATG